MSKNMNDKAKKAVQLDPSLFGYKAGDKVEIEGQALLQIVNFLGDIAGKGIQHLVKLSPRQEGESPIDWVTRSAEKQETYMPLESTIAYRLGAYLAGVHEQNVKTGKATHVSKLQSEVVSAEAQYETPQPEAVQPEVAEDKKSETKKVRKTINFSDGVAKKEE